MGKLAKKLKPSTCLEAIAGDMTGTIMDFLQPGGTMIVYGLLSEENVGNIATGAFLGKQIALEGYLLGEPGTLDHKSWTKLAKKTQDLMKTDLGSTVSKRFGFHQIKEAREYYKNNQTAGKVLLQSSLTKGSAGGAPATGSAAAAGGDSNGQLKVYTSYTGNTSFYNVKMTADFCNYPVTVVSVDAEMAKTKEIKDKLGAGRLPIAETSDGTIIQSSDAIAAYISRVSGTGEFLGGSAW